MVVRANGMHDRHHSTITLHHRNNIGPRAYRRREGGCLGPLTAAPLNRRGESQRGCRVLFSFQKIFFSVDRRHTFFIGEINALLDALLAYGESRVKVGPGSCQASLPNITGPAQISDTCE